MYMEIALTRIRGITEELKDNEKKLKVRELEIQEVEQELLRLEDMGMQELVRKLKKQRESLYEEIQEVQKFRRCLEKIVLLYYRCEKNAADYEPYMQEVIIPKFMFYNLRKLSRQLSDYGIKFQ